MPPPPVLLVLAAGASSRMRGTDKLMAEVNGGPLIERTVRRAAATGLPVVVALRTDRPERARAIARFNLVTTFVSDPGEGMAASLRAAAKAAPPGVGLMVVLADMPEIETADLLALWAAFEATGGERVVRAATAQGRPGQPVLFPARLREALLALEGDTGGRDLLAGEDVLLVPLAGERAVTDLDTPEDFARWRARACAE